MSITSKPGLELAKGDIIVQQTCTGLIYLAVDVPVEPMSLSDCYGQWEIWVTEVTLDENGLCNQAPWEYESYPIDIGSGRQEFMVLS